MSKYAFLTLLLFLAFTSAAVLFYWLGLRPAHIRKECGGIAMNASVATYRDAKMSKQKIAAYFRDKSKLETPSDRKSRDMIDDGLYLLSLYEGGYKACLELNGLRE